ncbi:hypothetical protein F9C07_2278969 [Aspergillus flavus]|uniref:Thiolase-like protein type 1 additional C-terminal domain-containing protein n=1 Tax=Aspergillus flavus (strain ATCC 200026 / FGSC A1120 / IAM 13836 / NRRL 3357 / JCM 12722 / SRRC 167) TaxID=332952 RepID=A0A7U2MPQ3_ASPFN|nr:hypothetical protein F9C07_2278969 [Aspergillus flavus]
MVPVIIGVADIKNKTTKAEDAKEPLQLMVEAIVAAIRDTQLSNTEILKLKSSIDSLSVVKTWTWTYADLPHLISQKLSISPRLTHYTKQGGNQPAKLLDEESLRIAGGQSRVSLITGGEALASYDLDGIHSIGLPIQVYPMYENGFRAHRGQSLAENHMESASLYSRFSQVAVTRPYSWNFQSKVETPESIAQVTTKNRMICLPYPLLMNAFNSVNLAAACIVTTAEYAAELGVPRSKWIYPLGGAGATDSEEVWNRPNFFSSPAISKSLDGCLASSGLTKNDIDLFDFYSCFPIVPKLASEHLGLSISSPSKPITLLGGLTFFGGAGNNYSMHAITEMVRQLRRGQGQNGLILANGGILTYQHAICLSSRPPSNGIMYPNVQNAHQVAIEVPIPRVTHVAEGDAVIETYTVEFHRNGHPARGYIIGRLKTDGSRFVANHGNVTTLRELASLAEEQIGKEGYVVPELISGGRRRNLFYSAPKQSI